VEFRVLGPLEVLEHGVSLALGGVKQRAVLAILLLHRGEVVSSERLIDELWGERPPATAAKTLQGYVSHLRKALGAGVLETHGHGYRLTVGPDQVDVDRFERLAAEGGVALSDGDRVDAAERLRRALGLWRGSPLADFAYEQFAQAEIARLEEARLAAIEDRIEADLALARHMQVVVELNGLIATHPHRERLHAQLMLALYRCGRQVDALDTYQRARRVLLGEFGIEPSERLRQLEAAILAQDRGLQLHAAPGQDTALRAVDTSPSTFVGREVELAELLSGLDDVFVGQGRLFLLGGEPGIGKSRLAQELTVHARARGAAILVGRCWEAGGAPAFWPWVQSLRSHVRDTDAAALRAQLGAGAADVAQLIPELRQRFPDLARPVSSGSEGARFALFDATTEFLRNASAVRPLLLVLDDLHAADEPSLLLLRFVARELGSIGVMLLCAYRDVDPVPAPPLSDTLAALAREPVARRLSLTGLSELEVAEFAEVTVGEAAGLDIVAGLHAETAGNPLFLGEIVRLMSTDAGLPDTYRSDLLGVPQTVRDVIGHRLRGLSPACQRALAATSVIGREFALAVVGRLLALSEDELLDVFDEALEARVLSEVPGPAGHLRFAHVLIRDTLYEGLSVARRVRLHRRTVDVLASCHGDESGHHLTELAQHAMLGREFDSAARFAKRAGERALALLAYEEAARLFGFALQALEHTASDHEVQRCALLLSLGEAETRAGNSPFAREHFLEAAGIARRVALPNELARAAAGFGGRIVWARSEGDDRLAPLLEEGLAAVGDEEVELRARLMARLAGALRDESSRDRRDRLSREAVELARQAGNAACLAYTLDGRAAAMHGPDTVTECLAIGTELCELAGPIGDHERVIAGHMLRIIAQLTTGDLHGAQAELELAARIADDLRQPAQLWQIMSTRALLALTTGQLTKAEALIDDAAALGTRSIPEVAIPVDGVQRYTLADFRGRLPEVEPTIVKLVAQYPARPVFRCVLAHLHARLGHRTQAHPVLGELTRHSCAAIPFDQEWLYGMSLLAETASLLGDTAVSAVLYRLLRPWAEFCAVDVGEGCRGSVSRYLGLLAATLHRPAEAEHHLTVALKTNTEMAARPLIAYTQRDYARMLLHHNEARDREHAEQLLSAASSTFDQLGMKT
jgi:DNA-binding SARP family transcriptional activator